MDCVMELGPDGTQTRYYVVQGELVMFERTPPGGSSATYQVLCDQMGSVRKVLAANNTVVAQFDYDAWGVLLPSSYDNVPNGGLMYRFVGCRGVRSDDGTGLYYMRQRWYDPMLQRFVGRDIKRRGNRYFYVKNQPGMAIDPSGKIPEWVTPKEVFQDPWVLNGIPAHSAGDVNDPLPPTFKDFMQFKKGPGNPNDTLTPLNWKAEMYKNGNPSGQIIRWQGSGSKNHPDEEGERPPYWTVTRGKQPNSPNPWKGGIEKVGPQFKPTYNRPCPPEEPMYDDAAMERGIYIREMMVPAERGPEWDMSAPAGTVENWPEDQL